MLVISVNVGEYAWLAGNLVHVMDVRGGRVRLGIEGDGEALRQQIVERRLRETGWELVNGMWQRGGRRCATLDAMNVREP